MTTESNGPLAALLQNKMFLAIMATALLGGGVLGGTGVANVTNEAAASPAQSVKCCTIDLEQEREVNAKIYAQSKTVARLEEKVDSIDSNVKLIRADVRELTKAMIRSAP